MTAPTFNTMFLFLLLMLPGCRDSHVSAQNPVEKLESVHGFRAIGRAHSGEILTIELKRSIVTQSVIDLISAVPVQGIQFAECTFSHGIDWSTLSNNRALRNVRFHDMHVRTMNNFESLTHIEQLGFTRCTGITSTVLRQVAALRQLYSLSLAGCAISSDDFQVLNSLPLVHLDISNTGLGDDVLPVLRSMPRLKMVTCAYANISDAAVRTMRDERDVDLER